MWRFYANIMSSLMLTATAMASLRYALILSTSEWLIMIGVLFRIYSHLIKYYNSIFCGDVVSSAKYGKCIMKQMYFRILFTYGIWKIFLKFCAMQ